jgi:hypothetical protein
MRKTGVSGKNKEIMRKIIEIPAQIRFTVLRVTKEPKT